MGGSVAVRLEFVGSGSNKFWEIEVAGNAHTVRYGAIGTEGREQTKQFDSASAAQASADKLIGEKKKKGYAEVGSTVTAASENAPPTVERQGDELLVRVGKRSIRLRYVELSRETEGEDEEDASSREHDRVAAELHLRLQSPQLGVPANAWVKLVELYCHDSYDGEYVLLLEDDDVYHQAFRAAAAALNLPISPAELTALVAPFTGYEEGFSLLLAEPDCWVEEGEAQRVVVVEEPQEVPLPVGDPKDLLARAAELIDRGVLAGERLGPDGPYEPYRNSAARDSPCFAEAQDILLSVDRVDATGAGHALRGRWYDRLEHQFYRPRPDQTAKAWEQALTCDSDNLEFVRGAAYAHIRANQEAKAIKRITQLLKADKNDGHAYFLRGCCYAKIWRLKRDKSGERAIADLTKAITLDPGDIRFYRARLAITRDMGNKELATVDVANIAECKASIAAQDPDPEQPRFEHAADQRTLDDILAVLRSERPVSERRAFDDLLNHWKSFAKRLDRESATA
jgi:predicted DNA-binding WGR domain protein/tetratricopeptide (TPR) repeat protein